MAPRSKDIADKIVTRFEKLKSDRGVWETHWRETAEVVFPRQDEFLQKRHPGEKRLERVFDSTPVLALDRFAATLESMLTPRNQKWHRLRATDPALNQNREVQEWFDNATRILFEKRGSQRANFASQMHEVYMSIGAFGNGPMFIDEDIGFGMRYRSIFLNDIYIQENHQRNVDTVFRKFEMTARQIAQKFSQERDTIPEKILTTLENKPDEKFEVLHCVKPIDDLDTPENLSPDMKFSSFYISVKDREIMREGGFRSFPYITPRYVVAPNEMYGRGPAMSVLPDIKMLNEMEKTTIRAAHKSIDPPLLLHDDGVLSRPNTKPGGLNFGGVNRDGRQLVTPLQTGANFSLGEDQKERKRRTINDAFLVTLFQILVDNPRMTATEVMERAQEKGALLSPAMGRLQNEALAPMIERELDILINAQIIPPMPQILVEAQGEFEIEFDSPLSRAQRAEEVIGIQRMFGDIQPLLQLDPSVMDIINAEEVARVSSEVHGVPFRIIRTDEEVQGIRAERQQAQQQQEQMAAIPQGAKAIKDVAEADRIAQAQG